MLESCVVASTACAVGAIYLAEQPHAAVEQHSQSHVRGYTVECVGRVRDGTCQTAQQVALGAGQPWDNERIL
eukprot:5693652-Alexandrium_andersonii.AAC.1